MLQHAAPSDNPCSPIKLPKESLKERFGTFTFEAFQVCLLAKGQQLSYTNIWKAELALNSVDFNRLERSGVGHDNNFCPDDGKAKELQ